MHSVERKLVGVLISILFLSACALSPIPSIPITRYTLNSLPLPAPALKKLSRSITLLVTEPTTQAIYNTTQIAYTPAPHQLNYFVKNRWAAKPTQMLHYLIVQTLQNTRHYHAVILSPFAGRYDVMLTTQLVQLQQDFSRQPSIVRVILRAQLTRAKNHRILAARQFSIIKVAPEDTPEGGVTAANQAVTEILKQLAEFCLTRA